MLERKEVYSSFNGHFYIGCGASNFSLDPYTYAVYHPYGYL